MNLHMPEIEEGSTLPHKCMTNSLQNQQVCLREQLTSRNDIA
jgi:hypothetical protein